MITFSPHNGLMENSLKFDQLTRRNDKPRNADMDVGEWQNHLEETFTYNGVIGGKYYLLLWNKNGFAARISLRSLWGIASSQIVF